MNPNKFGSFVGTGAAINIPLGFVPDKVEVFNETDGDQSWRWFKGMTDGHALQTASDGTQTRITSNGVSAYPGAEVTSSQGFTVGSALSESGKTFRYAAYRETD